MFYPDGRRIKISEDNIFTEAINPNWSAKKIFLPNLQPGCIVEYRYELRSEDIVTLHDWNFQTEIPTRWSEVTVITPNLLEYANLINRPRDFDVQEVETTNVLASDGNRVPAKLQRFGFANLPALNEEPFMTTIEDYRANIGFQLSTINYTDRLFTPYDHLVKYGFSTRKPRTIGRSIPETSTISIGYGKRLWMRSARSATANCCLKSRCVRLANT